MASESALRCYARPNAPSCCPNYWQQSMLQHSWSVWSGCQDASDVSLQRRKNRQSARFLHEWDLGSAFSLISSNEAKAREAEDYDKIAPAPEQLREHFVASWKASSICGPESECSSLLQASDRNCLAAHLLGGNQNCPCTPCGFPAST